MPDPCAVFECPRRLAVCRSMLTHESILSPPPQSVFISQN